MESQSDVEAAFPKPAISIRKAMIAGVVSGIAGTAVKTICELVSPPRGPGVESPLGNMLTAIFIGLTGHGIPPSLKPYAEPTTHWLFGTGAGLVYCVIAEKFPKARVGYGIAFGVVFWLMLHEIALPLVGFSPSPAKMTLWEQGNELVSHALFGLTVELVRRALRRKLE